MYYPDWYIYTVPTLGHHLSPAESSCLFDRVSVMKSKTDQWWSIHVPSPKQCVLGLTMWNHLPNILPCLHSVIKIWLLCCAQQHRGHLHSRKTASDVSSITHAHRTKNLIKWDRNGWCRNISFTYFYFH